MKIAFMFSGQGSEYLTMCQDLYNHHDTVKEMFNNASNILGYDVSDILFFNEEKLKDTQYTQPLMFVMYACIVEILKQENVTSSHTFGLSLGEYGALYDSGVITFEEGLKLLQKRGELMKKACLNTSGLMSAILGMDKDALEEIIRQISGYVVIANYNTYGQLVISGDEKSVLEVNKLAKEKGARRTILLNVDGPFHSELMSEARDDFKKYLDTYEFSEPKKKLLLNTTGTYYQSNIKEELINQITSSVYFYQMVEESIKDGVTNFIEIGPKKTLSSFVKKVNRNVNIKNIEDQDSLYTAISSLEGQNEV